MKPSILLLTLAAAGAAACTQRPAVEADYAVVPLPAVIETDTAAAPFRLNPDTRIVAADSASASNAAFLAEYIGALTGFAPEITATAPGSDYIRISCDKPGRADSYVITANADSLTVTGTDAAGAFYGVQTLRKTIPADAAGNDVLFAAGEVRDSPRFLYRGAHLDCARHFFSADSVKQFIDILALHNINRLHWHLTDDQGWRVEIKSRPRLTEVGSMRPQTVIGVNTGVYDSIPHGGFYTQEQLRDIVDYAAARHITIIPEIDLPGHMQAALASYPELGCTGGPYEVWQIWGVSKDVLCAGNDSVYAFLDDVMTEITDIFPSELIHIGGDECPKVRWQECPRCQARIRELGLRRDASSSAEEKLQSHLMGHVTDFLATRGRRVIGWDEMLEGGATDNAVIMSWRGTDGATAAARAGHDAIIVPYKFLYFDFAQSTAPGEPAGAHWSTPVLLEDVYNFEPVPEGLTDEEKEHIIGVQANLWSEFIPTFRHMEYMALPRMGALAELQWGTGRKDYADFSRRLRRLARHYDVAGYNYAAHTIPADTAASR